ncbi:ABC transporter substrate-binding protein [Sporomusa sphaeroides]|uniref:ABC transporter substrate-binding protein n=1 Tax=Sporomusa sphaeroides TaxID=47679 RepID=UPI002BAD2E65|nr:ABC transporter substrate-binding protein [Sporomusa sphaeroides]HML31796.1 ABC transporter substrate-binding protein [Sporomusa sphaeroides]
MGLNSQWKPYFLHTVILAVVGLVLLITGGCTGSNSINPPGTDSGSGSYELADSTGYVVRLPQKPQRIVSLSISGDEILMALVAPRRIAALTYLADDGGISNIVEQAKAIPGKVRGNAESVIPTQPDLVLMPDWYPAEFTQTLRDAGLTVYVYKTPDTIEEVKQSVRQIARVVREEEAGEQVVADMDRQLTQTSDRVKHIAAGEQKVVIYYSLMGGTNGKDSTFEDICRQAGVINGAAAAGLGRGALLSKEQLVAINPDIIILPVWDYTGTTDMKKFADDIQNDPALQSVKAIQDRQLIAVPDRHFNSTSQYIVQAVQDIAQAAYPQYF